MAKRAKKKLQKGRFRLRSGERSELQGSVVPGQRFNKLMPFPKMGKPASGYMAEARQRVPNLHKDEKDKRYTPRFKGTPEGVYEIKVRHEELVNGFQEDQWVDLFVSGNVCVRMFWKHGGQSFLVRYEALSMTYRTTDMFGNPERAKRAYNEGRVRWNEPLPMILDDD